VDVVVHQVPASAGVEDLDEEVLVLDAVLVAGVGHDVGPLEVTLRIDLEGRPQDLVARRSRRGERQGLRVAQHPKRPDVPLRLVDEERSVGPLAIGRDHARPPPST
jgi:hypothetical protein